MMQPKPSEVLQEHTAWTNEKKRLLKRYLLVFGYGRWLKIKKESKARDRLLNDCKESEIRPYANIFLLGLA